MSSACVRYPCSAYGVYDTTSAIEESALINDSGVLQLFILQVVHQEYPEPVYQVRTDHLRLKAWCGRLNETIMLFATQNLNNTRQWGRITIKLYHFDIHRA